jgi:hypothetical protein
LHPENRIPGLKEIRQSPLKSTSQDIKQNSIQETPCLARKEKKEKEKKTLRDKKKKERKATDTKIQINLKNT